MTKPNKLAVVVPSRGLAFGETLFKLDRELKGIAHAWYFSHNKPIPDCFNDPVGRALDDPAVSHVLICEDDMILPRGIIGEMLAADYPIVALDYPFKKNNEATALRDPAGFAFYTGTGCILINRIVLDKIPRPIFRADLAWDTWIKQDGTIMFWPRPVHKTAYGLHDVNFGLVMYANKLPIMVMDKTAGQLKLVARGKPGTNKGTHTIRRLTKVLKNNTTKNESMTNVGKFIRAMQRLTSVDIRTNIPAEITYIDGQAHLKGPEEDYEII